MIVNRSPVTTANHQRQKAVRTADGKWDEKRQQWATNNSGKRVHHATRRLMRWWEVKWRSADQSSSGYSVQVRRGRECDVRVSAGKNREGRSRCCHYSTAICTYSRVTAYKHICMHDAWFYMCTLSIWTCNNYDVDYLLKLYIFIFLHTLFVSRSINWRTSSKRIFSWCYEPVKF